MPLYDCECQKCSRVIEQLLLNGSDIEPCTCGGEMKKLPGTSSIVMTTKKGNRLRFYSNKPELKKKSLEYHPKYEMK